MLETKSFSISNHRLFLVKNQQRLAELLTFIDFAEGLTIGFIEVNRNEEANWIVESLMNNSQCQNIQFIVLNIDDSQVRFLLDEILNYLSKNPPLEDKKQVLIIKGLENSIGFKDYPPILQNLNFVRDAFTYDVPYPILFCLQNDTITRFARFAPDFWAWKSGIFKFESLPEEKNIDRQFVNFARVLERDGVSETQARIDLLTRLFAEYSAEKNISMMITTLQQLGVAYYRRGELQKAEESLLEAWNLSNQITSLEPTKVATLETLGYVYKKLKKYEEAETIYQQVLNVYSEQNFSQKWAKIQNSLGNVYLDKNQGSKADNLERAISCFNSALEVYTRDSFPSEWAMTQNNLGVAYSNRIRGERADNLELAIVAYNQSLEVYTRDSFPEQWAMTQNNLGNAYSDRIRGEKAENLELAIVALNQSLEVITPTAYPIDCLQTGRNLGNAANLIEDWETAIKGYNLAIEASEITLLEALNPQRQQEILSDAMDVYHGIVKSYLNLNQPDRALEYVERSKNRYLVQLLTDRDIYPKGNIPQTIITELDRLRRAIIGEEQRLAIQEQTRNRGGILTLDEQKQPILNDYTHLNQLKQELNQLIDREITTIDPTFSLTQKVESIPLSEIQSLIDQDTAILEWYISGDSIMAFIVTNEGLIPPNPPSKGLISPNPPSKGLIPPNPPSKGGNSEVKGVKVWQSSAEDREKLIDFIKDYRDAYENNKTEWIKNLNSCLNQLSEILQIDELLELIPKSCSRLILIPHWFLHIIPLHCLPLKNGQFLYQRFSDGVGYVPSCQLLKLVKSSRREKFDRLFAIKNPTRKDLKPLLGANLEIERISQGFATEKTIIIGELEASEQTLENRRQELQASHCLHFSCHGKFNNESPRDSALMLADPDGNLGELANLTLAEVFEKFDLRECRLVTFSACESGIIESKADSISDEYVGLPSGFLFAGSSSVVSTLWTVDPLATTLFMAKFYHDLKRISLQDQGSIAIVLNHTQTWLRTLNSQKLAQTKNSQEFQQLLDQVFESKRDRRKFQDLLEAAVKREPYPFANPYYWTAFIATGV